MGDEAPTAARATGPSELADRRDAELVDGEVVAGERVDGEAVDGETVDSETVDSETVEAVVIAGDERLGEPRGEPWLAVLLTWLLPGLGHAYLGRRRRGAAFAALVGLLIWVGVVLQGPLWSVDFALPELTVPRIGSLGPIPLHLGSEWLAAPMVVLSWSGYQGEVTELGYEYGMTYLLTASLFSLLLMFDAWDVSKGLKP